MTARGAGARVLALMLVITTGCATARPVARCSPPTHVSDGGKIELVATTAQLVQIIPYNPKHDLVTSERRARHRTTDRRPTFECACVAADVLLFRLRPGKELNDRNFAVRVKADVTGTTLLPLDATVELAIEEGAGDVLRITPRQPLEPGEYAFVSQSQMNSSVLKVRMFDFGVD